MNQSVAVELGRSLSFEEDEIIFIVKSGDEFTCMIRIEYVGDEKLIVEKYFGGERL